MDVFSNDRDNLDVDSEAKDESECDHLDGGWSPEKSGRGTSPIVDGAIDRKSDIDCAAGCGAECGLKRTLRRRSKLFSIVASGGV